MIIRICQDTPKLALKIVQAGCDGLQLMDDTIELELWKRHCEPCLRTEHFYDDCGIRRERQIMDETIIVYPAFDIDADGRVVFYFDDNLWNSGDGRYAATIKIAGHTRLCFDLEVCMKPLMIEEAVLTSSTGCSELC